MKGTVPRALGASLVLNGSIWDLKGGQMKMGRTFLARRNPLGQKCVGGAQSSGGARAEPSGGRRQDQSGPRLEALDLTVQLRSRML